MLTLLQLTASTLFLRPVPRTLHPDILPLPHLLQSLASMSQEHLPAPMGDCNPHPVLTVTPTHRLPTS